MVVPPKFNPKNTLRAHKTKTDKVLFSETLPKKKNVKFQIVKKYNIKKFNKITG